MKCSLISEAEKSILCGGLMGRKGKKTPAEWKMSHKISPQSSKRTLWRLTNERAPVHTKTAAGLHVGDWW